MRRRYGQPERRPPYTLGKKETFSGAIAGVILAHSREGRLRGDRGPAVSASGVA